MKKSKKIVLFVSMVLVLAAAAILNVTLLAANGNNNDDNTTPTGSFFASSRQDRLTTRNYEIEQLNDIIDLEGDEFADARQSAIEQKQSIVDAMETELLLETLLKAQGYEDVLVSVSATSEMITVIIDKDDLEYEDTVLIYYLIQEKTNLSSDYVSFLAI